MDLIVGNVYIDEDGDRVKVVYISSNGEVCVEWKNSLLIHHIETLYIKSFKPAPKIYYFIKEPDDCLYGLYYSESDASNQLVYFDENSTIVKGNVILE